MSASYLKLDMKNEQHRELLKSFIDTLALQEYDVVEASVRNWANFVEIVDGLGVVENRYMYSDFEINIVGTSYPAKENDEYPLKDCVL